MPTPPLSKGNKSSLLLGDGRNVLDKYKSWDMVSIKADLARNKQGLSVAMFQLSGDFNFSCVVRSANAFGADRVYYIGRKRWDKRGSVGTHHYIDVVHCKDYDDFLDRTALNHSLIAIENNIDFDCADLRTFKWPQNPILIFGEEGTGLADEVLHQVDHIVTIPQFGSVRSLNAASAATAVMYDYILKKEESKNE